MTRSPSDPALRPTDLPPTDGLLRASLRANASFSALSGLCFVLASAPLADFLDVAPPALVTGVGVNLLGFAAALLWLASRPSPAMGLVRLVIALDLAWVAGTIAGVYADAFSRAGALASLGVAGVVAGLAGLQWIGLRRRVHPVTGTETSPMAVDRVRA